MLAGRKRRIIALASLAAVVAVGLAPATPTFAEPDIDNVQAKVDRLYHEAEQASERYNDLKLEREEIAADLAALHADQSRQQTRLERARDQVEDSVVRQYLGQSVSAVGQVVVSEDPSEFLSQLSTMSAFNDLQDDLFDDYAVELKALRLREEATAERVSELTIAEDKMAAEKQAIDTKFAEAKELLDKLKAEERARFAAASRSSSALPTGPLPPPSGRAAAAVAYARAQVGDAYVYGAAGPSAFDCSGLTMMAWAQAGVGLPHSSGAQMGSGPRVSSGSLQPGDLVFYYSPVSHVGIYIGNGLIVHAARPGVGVVVAGVFSMPFSGAVRPG